MAIMKYYNPETGEWEKVVSVKFLKGDPFTYEDFTEEQLAALKGDPFTYDDFTEEQLEALTGKDGKDGIPTKVTGTGVILCTIEDNYDYSFTDVTSLTLVSAIVNAHGFITFAASTPTINVSGFTASDGDDITSAAASQVWEFSVYSHNGGSYIIWKNWSD